MHFGEGNIPRRNVIRHLGISRRDDRITNARRTENGESYLGYDRLERYVGSPLHTNQLAPSALRIP